jgi:hypothetical protein
MPWVFPAMLALLVAAVAIALTAAWMSWRAYGRRLIEPDSGRIRFLALWGVILGTGFALASILTAVALFILPQCARWS